MFAPGAVRLRVALVIFVGLCGCRKQARGADAGAIDASALVDASSGDASTLDASATIDAPPVPHVANEAERTYVRKLRALLYRCKNGHDDIACNEGRMRAGDFSGVHCGRDGVDPTLRFAWAGTSKIENATARPFGEVTLWVEDQSALRLDDIDRIDQEPMFLDRDKGYAISDAYDGNNVIGSQVHIRFRRAWLSAAELARARAMERAGRGHGGEQFGLVIVRGEKVLAIALGDLDATMGKRVVVDGAAAGLCAKTESWELPEDLEGAFDSP